MYLVELRPGKEELYRSSDELALAIRNGDVDSRSRVYHRATAKWISITLHPQYRAIVAAAKEDAGGRPLRRVWGMLSGGGVSEQGLPPQQQGPANGPAIQYRWRRPLALGISALLLISGIQLAFSRPRPQWGKPGRVAVVTKPAQNTQRAVPAERTVQEDAVGDETASGLVSLASNSTVWDEPADSMETDNIEPAPAKPLLPRAPTLRSNSLKDALAPGAVTAVAKNSLQGLLARYTAAHDAAQSRLETGMRVARLTKLFAASRLSPDGGITDTRMSLAGAANIIRVYRQQQAAIEKAYQDTVTSLARQQSWSAWKVRQWYSRPPRKEAPTLELISGSLVSSFDSLLGVLNAQAGAYKIRGTAIAFEDPAASQAYGALRRKIKEQIDAAVAAGGATSPGVTGLLLQAIGTSSLPRET
jgi:hypothetical protein